MRNFRKTVSVSSLLVAGTLNSLLAKIVYELHSTGRDGKEKLFRKPWASTALMFLAMMVCLPLGYVQKKKSPSPLPDEEEPGAQEALLPQSQQVSPTPPPPTGPSKPRSLLLLAVPTLFDLTATVLMSVGLLYVTASVYQMMRGAEMLFAALFSVVFLKRPLHRLHYGGLALCVSGILAVGFSSVLSSHGQVGEGTSAGGVVLGILLIVAAQAVQAGQVTVEDYCMQGLGFEPLQVVGYEGLFGSILMFAVALPVVQQLPGREGDGVHEDSLDTWHMITHSWVVAAVLLVNIVALTAYNVAGMFVTEAVGAAARTVLETLRTVFVWLGGLLLFYLGGGEVGEAWNRYSWLQLAGFAVLVVGTYTYDQGDEQVHKKLEQAGRQPDGVVKLHVFKAPYTLLTGHLLPRRRFRAAVLATLAQRRFHDFAEHDDGQEAQDS